MNRSRKVAIVCLILIGSTAATNAYAMRCGTHLISRGDHVSKLLRYCGEPDFEQSRSAQRSYHNRFGQVLFTGFHEQVQIDEWTYNLGPNKLMRVVTMENGVVREVRHLGYGYHHR